MIRFHRQIQEHVGVILPVSISYGANDSFPPTVRVLRKPIIFVSISYGANDSFPHFADGASYVSMLGFQSPTEQMIRFHKRIAEEFKENLEVSISYGANDSFPRGPAAVSNDRSEFQSPTEQMIRFHRKLPETKPQVVAFQSPTEQMIRFHPERMISRIDKAVVSISYGANDSFPQLTPNPA